MSSLSKNLSKSLSVVTLTWKREPIRLRRLVASLLRQTRIPNEIIIVDGSPGDPYLGIIAKRTRILAAPIEQFSLSKLFNYGIKRASGDYIMTCGAEMLFSPTFLEHMMPMIDETHMGVGGCGFLTEDTDYDVPDWLSLWAQVIPGTAAKMSPGAFQIISRDWWHKVRGYDETLPFAFVDSDILQRSRADGMIRVQLRPTQVQVMHQWHPTSELVAKLGGDYKYVKQNTSIVRNLDGWGEL